MPITLKPVLRENQPGLEGFSLLLEGAGAAPVINAAQADLEINGGVSTRHLLLPHNLKEINATQKFIFHLSFRHGSPASGQTGGGVGTVTVTVNGTPQPPIQVGYGDPPPGHGGELPVGDSKS